VKERPLPMWAREGYTIGVERVTFTAKPRVTDRYCWWCEEPIRGTAVVLTKKEHRVYFHNRCWKSEEGRRSEQAAVVTQNWKAIFSVLEQAGRGGASIKQLVFECFLPRRFVTKYLTRMVEAGKVRSFKQITKGKPVTYYAPTDDLLG
jgi:predicted transcriptional regulator